MRQGPQSQSKMLCSSSICHRRKAQERPCWLPMGSNEGATSSFLGCPWRDWLTWKEELLTGNTTCSAFPESEQVGNTAAGPGPPCPPASRVPHSPGGGSTDAETQVRHTHPAQVSRAGSTGAWDPGSDPELLKGPCICQGPVRTTATRPGTIPASPTPSVLQGRRLYGPPTSTCHQT